MLKMVNGDSGMGSGQLPAGNSRMLGNQMDRDEVLSIRTATDPKDPCPEPLPASPQPSTGAGHSKHHQTLWKPRTSEDCEKYEKPRKSEAEQNKTVRLAPSSHCISSDFVATVTSKFNCMVPKFVSQEAPRKADSRQEHETDLALAFACLLAIISATTSSSSF